VRSAKTIEPTSLGFVLLCETCKHPDTNHLPGVTSDLVKTFDAMMKASKMKRDDLFPSRYFKAADLGGKPLDLVIKSAGIETLKNMQGTNEDKLVLGFVGQKKLLVTNRTNFDAIAELHGDETNGWINKRIQLYPDKAHVGGKSVDAVRVRATSADAFNDAIPV
jgi:hypothetical protein